MKKYYLKQVMNQILNRADKNYKTDIDNINEESQVSLVTDLKHHLLV